MLYDAVLIFLVPADSYRQAEGITALAVEGRLPAAAQLQEVRAADFVRAENGRPQRVYVRVELGLSDDGRIDPRLLAEQLGEQIARRPGIERCTVTWARRAL